MGRYDRTKKKKTSLWRWMLIVVMATGLATAGWLFVHEVRQAESMASQARVLPPPEFDDAMMAAEILADTETNVTVESAVEAEVPDLPKLAESDEFIRQQLLKLSPGLASWLPVTEVLRQWLVIVNDFSQGSRPAKHLQFLLSKEPFRVDRDGTGEFIADASYRRFDVLAAAIDAVDVNAAIEVYQTIRPLMLEVYADFSYPDGHRLEDLFLQAGAEILAAPIVKGRIDVIRPSVQYRFADPKLEALSPVQKQLLRLGPKNGEIIQNKVRQWVERLSADGE